MSKTGESTATPRLRFPEFRNTEAWKNSALGSIAAILKGKGIAKSDVVPEGARPCIRYGELYTLYGEVIDAVYSRTNVPDSELFLSKKNDVIIPASGETKLDIATAACVIHDDVALGSDLNVLRTSQNGVFLSYLLNSSKRHEIAKVAQGDTVVHLYPSQLREIVVPLADAREQERIADCLTSLDDVIAAQAQKVEALKAHKRGLMQQLFPREGETVPLLRFPEFRHGPEWAGTAIGRIVDFRSGGTPSKVNPAFWNGSIPWVSAKDMKRLFLEDTIDRITAAAIADGAKLMPVGTVLMLTRGMTLLKDLPVCVLRREMSFNQDVKALIPKGDLDSHFLPYLLLGNKDILLRMVDVAGHGTGRLDTEELKAVTVMLPRVEEQRRIADFLDSVDSVLASETEKLDALKLHKHSLLEQLFPVPEDSR